MLWKDDVLPLSQGDYDRAGEDFLRVANQVREITSIWKSGSVSVPGISDLDFILVVRDNTRLSWKNMRNNLNQDTLRVLLHSPVAITESLAPWLGYVIDTRGLRLLEGKTLSFAEPENRHMVNLLVSARLTMAKLMGLVRTEFIGRGSIRSFLSRANSIRHNFTLMEMSVPPIFDELAELRESWFKKRGESLVRLDKLLAGARETCVALLREIRITCAVESGSDELSAGNWRFFGGEGYRERKGMLSWLPRRGRAGELAYYSTWFELGITPGLSGLLAGTIGPANGRLDWERHLEIIKGCEETAERLSGFSSAAPLLSLRGWRRWVP